MAEKKEINKFNKDEITQIKNEFEREMRAKRKEVVDRVVRVLGLLAAVYIYVLIFSSTTALTFFGYFYSSREGYQSPEELWLPVLQTADIYKFLMGGPYPGLAIILLSFVQIGLGATLGVLIAIYIKDMIGVIRSFFGIGKDIIINASESVKEGVEDMIPKGKLFSEEETKVSVKTEKKTAKKNEEKPVQVEQPRREQPQPQLKDEDLDKLLNPNGNSTQPKAVVAPINRQENQPQNNKGPLFK
jgi:hypothetical protein